MISPASGSTGGGGGALIIVGADDSHAVFHRGVADRASAGGAGQQVAGTFKHHGVGGGFA